MIRLHGTVVSLDGAGLLLRGASGSGKSDLALRLIEAGAVLVADDQVELTREGEQIYAAAPAELAGLLEVRHVGIRRLRHLTRAPVAALVDLVPSGMAERLPEARSETIEGVCLPVIEIAPFEASAVARLSAFLGRGLAPSETVVGLGEAPPAASAARRVLVITGMSGAGRSTSLKYLEDLGYEAVDNLPVSLLSRLSALSDQPTQPIAVGIDIRTRDFSVDKLVTALDAGRDDPSARARLVFLDCDDDVLIRRFTETRRPHPLSGDRPVIDGIGVERALLAPLRARADLLIDTSGLRAGDLRRLLDGHFGAPGRHGLKLFVTSFSFREGIPREADLVFDVRFLRNPFYEPDLKALTGLDASVGRFVAADPGWQPFFAALGGLLDVLLPGYDHEGKSYLTIAIGCTGGRHRSVYTAERLGGWLAERGYGASVGHRDIDRPQPVGNAAASPQAERAAGAS